MSPATESPAPAIAAVSILGIRNTRTIVVHSGRDALLLKDFSTSKRGMRTEPNAMSSRASSRTEPARHATSNPCRALLG